jgi:hypothetical protein
MTAQRLPFLSRFSRRSALSLLAAGATGGALFRRGPSAALAAPGDIPKRLIFFYTQQGTLRNLWAPTGSETSFELGQLHGPLQTYKNDLLFLHGLDMRSNDVDPTSPANAHYGGTTHALTSINRQSGTLPSGPSIDQFIAGELNKAAPLTAFPSLELAAADVSFGEWAVSFTGSGQPVAFSTEPSESYDRLFGNFTAPDDTAALARREQDELVLSYAAGEFDAKAPSFGKEDRLKLQAHAATLRDLQQRLTLTAGSTCTKPDATGFENKRDYVAIADANQHLAAAALACDLTRVVTLALPELPSKEVGYTSGAFGTTDLHDLVHKTAENGELKDNLDAVEPIKRYHQYHAQQFADFLALLDGIPESDGQSLLDHSVVLWCGQLGSGSHDLSLLPWILAGSGGGYFKPGRFLQLPRANNQGLAHSDLFVSLANYMGLDITTFGNPQVCEGPLPGLRA